MAQSQKESIKIGDVGKDFLCNLRTNRRQKIEGNPPVDKKDLSFWELMRLLKQFFIQNPKQYLELVKMEYKNKNKNG